MIIARNDDGSLSLYVTVHNAVFTRFLDTREFSVMQIMGEINRHLPAPEHLTIYQVTRTLNRLSQNDDRVIRVAAGRYRWHWAQEAAR